MAGSDASPDEKVIMKGSRVRSRANSVGRVVAVSWNGESQVKIYSVLFPGEPRAYPYIADELEVVDE